MRDVSRLDGRLDSRKDVVLPLPCAGSRGGFVDILVDELDERAAKGEGIYAGKLEVHVGERKLLVNLRLSWSRELNKVDTNSRRTHRVEKLLVCFLAIGDGEGKIGRLDSEAVVVDAAPCGLVGLGGGDIDGAVGANVGVVGVDKVLAIEANVEVRDGIWRVDLAGLDIVRDGCVEDDVSMLLDDDAIEPLYCEVVGLVEDAALEDAVGRGHQRHPLANGKVDVDLLAVVCADVRICDRMWSDAAILDSPPLRPGGGEGAVPGPSMHSVNSATAPDSTMFTDQAPIAPAWMGMSWTLPFAPPLTGTVTRLPVASLTTICGRRSVTHYDHDY